VSFNIKMYIYIGLFILSYWPILFLYYR